MNNSPSTTGAGCSGRNFLILLGALALVLALLFHRSFEANQVLYSNDGPLGLISAKSVATTVDSFRGMWYDLNWLGYEAVTPAPTFTALMALTLKPLGWAKFSVPLALLAIGLSAWLFFKELKLAPVACVLGGMAAALNSDFFSTACWGVVGDACCAAACYLALAAITRVANVSSKWPWFRVILAGIAVGLAVMEAYDVGALFSLCVAAYVLYQAIFLDERPGAPGKKFVFGVVRVGLVAAFAAFTAAHVLTSLVGSQVTGVVGMEQTPEARKARWDGATEWSLPKAEILQVLVPGLFGYRQTWHMYDDEQPKEDQYWGTIGAQPQIADIQKELSNPNPQIRAQADNTLKNAGLMWRLSGTGLYAGVLVVVVAIWGALQALRKKGSPYALLQRRALWFWSGALMVTMLLGFGRYAPFYQLFYALPYAPTIRNPTKFMHIFSWIIVIVFAYGVHGLALAYLQKPEARGGGLMARFKNWWAGADRFEKRWQIGCGVAVILSLLGALMYNASNSDLKNYLTTVGINPADAQGVASFSGQAMGWFALFMVLTMAVLAAIFCGQFAGPRVKWAGIFMGVLLAADLGRADKPWMVYFDTDFKYGNDPVVSYFADKPYEHRVSFLPWWPPNVQQLGVLNAIYGTAWKQHLFWYKNVQCLDVAQESRLGTDKVEFINALHAEDPQHNPAGTLRYWELTNTRYLLGPEGQVIDALNRQLDPVEKRFRFATFPDGKPVWFNLTLKRPTETPSSVDFVAEPGTNGQLSVIEFTGALPRASLFSNWQVMTNDQDTLKTLGSANFNPHQMVLVADAIAAPAAAATNGLPAGDVTITDYAPKRIQMEADVKAASVLLLCDRYNAKWQVWVDGQQAKLLRCNFIARGVQLPPGKHKVEFVYSPPVTTLYISLAALLTGLVLLGLVVVTKDPEGPAAEPTAAKDKPGKG